MSSILTNPNNCIEVVKILITNGADPNIQDNYDRTALDYAKNKDVIDYLKNNGGLFGREL